MGEGDFTKGFRVGYDGSRFVLAVWIRDIGEQYRSIALEFADRVNNVIPEGRIILWNEYTAVFWTSFEVPPEYNLAMQEMNKHLLTGHFVADMFNRLYDHATGERFVGQPLLPAEDVDMTFDTSDRIFYPCFKIDE